MTRTRLVLLSLVLTALSARANTLESGIVMSAQDQARMGVTVALAKRIARPNPRSGYGRVLDVAPLAVLDAELAALEATAAASAAESARTESLFHDGENASRRQWESARAQARADAARLQATRQRLALEWGEVVAGMRPAARADLIAKLVQGRSSLIRASAPGFSPEPGARIQANLRPTAGGGGTLRMLGRAANADPQIPGTAFLLLAEDVSLQPGSSVPVGLGSGEIEGLQLPAAALVADRRGLSVYVRSDAERFERVWVRVLLDEGDTVLVEGLPERALVVVSNAAALHWSEAAKARGKAAADEDGDDD